MVHIQVGYRAWNKDLKVCRHNVRTWSVVFRHFQILYRHFRFCTAIPQADPWAAATFQVLPSADFQGQIPHSTEDQTWLWFGRWQWLLFPTALWALWAVNCGCSNHSAELLLEAMSGHYAGTFLDYITGWVSSWFTQPLTSGCVNLKETCTSWYKLYI